MGIKYSVGVGTVLLWGHVEHAVAGLASAVPNGVVYIRDAVGHSFATRATNVFVIGKGDKPLVSLPKGKGILQSILQEQAKIFGKTAAVH